MILEWNILHRVDSHVKHPKNSNHARPGKQILGKQIRPKFLLSTSLLYKILLTNPGVCKPFILFIHHIWGETALFIIQTSHRIQYFTIFQDKYCTQSIFRTINCGLLAKPFKKFPKSPIRPASFHFWWAPNLQWTLVELRFNIINSLLFIFLFRVL